MTPDLRVRALKLSAWLVAIGIVAALLPVAVAAVALPGCSGCHRARGLVGTVTSEKHAASDATCVSCHVGPGAQDRVRFAFYEVYGMTLPLVSVNDSPISLVPDAACSSCHADLSGITVASGLRIQHKTCAEGSACVDCHAQTAHGDAIAWPTSYDMDRCLACHDAEKAFNSCDTCHEGKLTQARPENDAWRITHGPDWEKTHGMGDMTTCRACHREDYCTPCHGPGVPHGERFFETHAKTSRVAGSKCTSCHAREFCDSCHGIEMPHPPSFTPEHSSLVARDGDALCMTCHVRKDCTLCHEKHVHPGGAVPLSPDGRTRP